METPDRSEPGGASGEEALYRQVVRVLDDQVRPRVQSHGGDVTLERVEEGTVYVRFHAACHACPLKPVTLFVTVRHALLAVEGVEEVEAVGVRVPEPVRKRLTVLSGDPG